MQEEFKLQEVAVSGPLNNLVTASYLHNGHEAYLEVAQGSGLQLVPAHLRDPYKTSSKGVGQLIRHAFYENNVRKIFIGCGGSAFVDGGIGALSEVGIDVFDAQGQLVNTARDNYVRGDSIFRASQLRVRDERILKELELTVLTDVRNPLFGE